MIIVARYCKFYYKYNDAYRGYSVYSALPWFAACSSTLNGKIGVIGTQATIKSGSYGRAIKTIRPNSFVLGKACPLFVPLVENGYTDRENKIAKMVAEEYLEPLKKEDIDTLILGCTHYPLLKDIISDIMGDDVTLISSGEKRKIHSTYF